MWCYHARRIADSETSHSKADMQNEGKSYLNAARDSRPQYTTTQDKGSQVPSQ